MKPNGPLFDRAWRNSCKVVGANKRLVDAMIKRHYIGKWPQSVMLVLALKRGSKTLGVITLSPPHREMVERFGRDT